MELRDSSLGSRPASKARADSPILAPHAERLSYVSGPSSKPLLGMTIGRAFDDTVQQWGNREALVVPHQSIRWTYADLAERVDALAAGLLSYGLSPGDRVSIWSPNGAEWVVIQFAAAKAGIILVNINPAYRAAELGYVLRKVGCRALITATAFKTSDYLAMLVSVAPDFSSRVRHVPARCLSKDCCRLARPRRRSPGFGRSPRRCSSTTRSIFSSRAGQRDRRGGRHAGAGADA